MKKVILTMAAAVALSASAASYVDVTPDLFDWSKYTVSDDKLGTDVVAQGSESGPWGRASTSQLWPRQT